MRTVIKITFDMIALLGWVAFIALVIDQYFNHGHLLIKILMRS